MLIHEDLCKYQLSLTFYQLRKVIYGFKFLFSSLISENVELNLNCENQNK